MGIFLKQLYKIPPLIWGSYDDRVYAVKKNSEKTYDVDPDSNVLVVPDFWGLPPLDYSGKNNHGTNYGTTYKNGSLDFDGNDYIQIKAADSLNNINTALTILSWVRPRQLSGISIFSKTISDTINTQFLLFFQTSSLRFRIVKSGGLNTILSNVGIITINTDYYCAATWDGDAMKMNVNGVLQSDTKSVASPIDSGSGVSNIGRLGSDAWKFDGFIYNTLISNIAYSADQIALFHDLPYALYQPVSRPVYFFQAAPPIGAIMNQFQGVNLGADLFNGTLL